MNLKTTREILVEFGSEMRKLRMERNLRLVDIAERSGVSLETIQKMETGQDFRMSSWIKVSRHLEQDPMALSTSGDNARLSPIDLANKLSKKDKQRVRVH